MWVLRSCGARERSARRSARTREETGELTGPGEGARIGGPVSLVARMSRRPFCVASQM